MHFLKLRKSFLFFFKKKNGKDYFLRFTKPQQQERKTEVESNVAPALEIVGSAVESGAVYTF